MKWYGELQLAWAQKPPADWLKAAELKYKPPREYRTAQRTPEELRNEMLEKIQQIGLSG